MPDTLSPSAQPLTLSAQLEAALSLDGQSWGIGKIRPMADTGLAHHHLWLSREGDDWVARLPKQSQLGLDARANLDYQAACFARAGESGHTPALHGVLPPSKALPRGGLLVSAINGRPARLPQDLPAIARALAALHGLPLPSPDRRPPLLAPKDPWSAMRDEVATQAAFLDEAGLDSAVRRAIESELTALPETLPGSEARLISFDAHPGNFLMTDDGRAVLVDLEKCRYGLPGFDLAHATLYTSTTWDMNSYAELAPDEVASFYHDWAQAAGPAGGKASLLACRRAMWLWSLTWCAKWRASHRRAQDATARGEDWSAELSDDALVAHVRDRVEHYLSLPVIERVRAELRDLATALPL
ncbi:phosphotransferase [Halomonas campisalis]|uniref:Phosphotransferase n=1 Tax=Billgrantia campisalis TaxID=74661 RepID=A0ABS9P8L7_9GAMM|nr:aminoglycoside phosphotransferase family protein [Halomonas campisalis]MCG6658120.1 phosphotransferase [Halomonas campisalis]MDR5862787.1 aminoglycoside phosphotransferase family protein [Halomonas campisalis]